MLKECPKCGNPRFGYNPRYQSYCCASCGFEDKSILIPSEVSAYKKFERFMKMYTSGGGSVERAETKCEEFTYDKFKDMMNKYIEEEVRPAQEAKTKGGTKK